MSSTSTLMEGWSKSLAEWHVSKFNELFPEKGFIRGVAAIPFMTSSIFSGVFLKIAEGVEQIARGAINLVSSIFRKEASFTKGIGDIAKGICKVLFVGISAPFVVFIIANEACSIYPVAKNEEVDPKEGKKNDAKTEPVD